MTPGFTAYAMGTLLWAALIAFAVLGGADFGAGFWDLLSHGKDADKTREAVVRAIGPIWEANAIWVVYFVTGLWTVFPTVFSTLTTVLFIPLAVALLGIVMRGAAFAYFTHFRGAVNAGGPWERVFSLASTFSPFLLGAALAAVAGGHIRVRAGQPVAPNYFEPWLTPFAIACGLFAVALCAVLAATYLTVEGVVNDDPDLTAFYRRRALIAGAVTSVIGAVAAILARADAPRLWEGLVGKALPLSLMAMALGVATAGALLLRRFRIARFSVAAMVTFIFAAWAWAQLPYLIPPDVTIANSVASPAMQFDAFITSLIGLPIILVSLWYLLYVFKSKQTSPRITAGAYADSLQEPKDNEGEREDNVYFGGARGRQLNAELTKKAQKAQRGARNKSKALVQRAHVGRSLTLTAIQALVALVLPVALRSAARQRDRRAARQHASRELSYRRDEPPATSA